MAHYVYRLFDHEGVVIYIGCSDDLAERLKYHRHHQPWWHEVARHDVLSVHPDTQTGRAAEREAIIAARPRRNVRHAGAGPMTDACGGGSMTGYERHRARGEAACVECQAARAAFDRERYARYLASGKFEHGSATGYTIGCRCDECPEYNREAMRKHRAKRRAAA